MDTRLVVLKLFLDALNIPSEIKTVDDRKKVQKAIYLGQLTGVDLGYRFGWYLMGPYCPSLTKDYFELSDAMESGESDYEGHELLESIKSKLGAIQPLLSPPETLALPREDWLELISSYHFLKTISKKSESEVKQTFEEEKEHLVQHLDVAKDFFPRLEAFSH